MVMGSTLVDDFPKLRVGFLEASIEWTTRLVKGLGDKKRPKIQRWLAERAFVACARHGLSPRRCLPPGSIGARPMEAWRFDRRDHRKNTDRKSSQTLSHMTIYPCGAITW